MALKFAGGDWFLVLFEYNYDFDGGFQFLQECLLGAAIASGLVGFVIFYQRNRIYESISDYLSQLEAQFQVSNQKNHSLFF